ncbi:MAG: hypothetical protein ABR558_06805 [Thioalkalivibrio sp.]
MSGVPRLQEQNRVKDVRPDPRQAQEQHARARAEYMAAHNAVAINEEHIEILLQELAQARQDGEDKETCAAIHDALKAKERLHQARVLRATGLRAPYLEARQAHLVEMGREHARAISEELRMHPLVQTYVRESYATWCALGDPSSGRSHAGAARARVEALCRPILGAMQAYATDEETPSIDDLLGELHLVEPLPDEALDAKPEIRARWAPTRATEERPS